ncbi:hypothetical protein Spea_2202 [Shewanella pealeana ATCC 700345]|uniref:Uncharacterized protein n=1 Tax=Shewanella pealeana (strain ATCC 700345 / ANG-SQ1) TaxID=398579 RepID=A8H4N5_SHEPA|nr:hypothetical protein Spea_2202 [Shewanella pealeana ATCC 700345]
MKDYANLLTSALFASFIITIFTAIFISGIDSNFILLVGLFGFLTYGTTLSFIWYCIHKLFFDSARSFSAHSKSAILSTSTVIIINAMVILYAEIMNGWLLWGAIPFILAGSICTLFIYKNIHLSDAC